MRDPAPHGRKRISDTVSRRMDARLSPLPPRLCQGPGRVAANAALAPSSRTAFTAVQSVSNALRRRGPRVSTVET